MINITIDNEKKSISEHQLCGMLCCMVSIFKQSPLFEINISTNNPYKILPKSFKMNWSLSDKYQEVKEFCQNLQKNIGTEYIEIIPLYNTKSGPSVKYNIDPIHTNDFGFGYMSIANMIRDIINQEYTSHFPANIEFLNNCKLVDSNNVKMKTPTYVWNLPKITNIPSEQLTSNLINLFLRNCSEGDHKLLMIGKYYLRFFLYQDTPDTLPNSYPYVHAYIRAINECTFNHHKETLLSISNDELPCEVNYVSRGFFFTFPYKEWLYKNVENIYMID